MFAGRLVSDYLLQTFQHVPQLEVLELRHWIRIWSRIFSLLAMPDPDSDTVKMLSRNTSTLISKVTLRYSVHTEFWIGMARGAKVKHEHAPSRGDSREQNNRGGCGWVCDDAHHCLFRLKAGDHCLEAGGEEVEQTRWQLYPNEHCNVIITNKYENLQATLYQVRLRRAASRIAQNRAERQARQSYTIPKSLRKKMNRKVAISWRTPLSFGVLPPPQPIPNSD